MKRRAAVLLATLVAALGLSVTPAGAGSVLVVDDDPRHGRCRVGHVHPDDRFPTIQEAVDEADPGDVIWVCPGRYEETVTVTDDRITILGAKAGQDARRRSRRHESVVTGDPEGAPLGAVRLLGDKIVWDGFLVRDNLSGPGLSTAPDGSGYQVRNNIFQDNGIGVHLGSDGRRTTWVTRNLFIANNEFSGPGAGSGVYSSEGATDVRITDNRFERHNGAGILFADHPAGDQVPQQDVLVARNQSVGDLTFAAFFDSTRVCITENLVRARVGDPDFPGPAAGIFVGARNDGVVVQYNRIESATGSGIDVRDTPADKDFGADPPRNVRVLKNKVRNVELHGVDVSASAPGQYEVRGNRALDNQGVGIYAGGKTAAVRFLRNTAMANRARDCQDDSHGGGTAGTANTWEANTGATALPGGICTPPQDDGHDKPGHGKKKHHKKHKKHKKPPKVRCRPCRF